MKPSMGMKFVIVGRTVLIEQGKLVPNTFRESRRSAPKTIKQLCVNALKAARNFGASVHHTVFSGGAPASRNKCERRAPKSFRPLPAVFV